MPKPNLEEYNLYLVISQEYAPDRDPLEVAELAIKGGVDIIQMREKKMPPQDLVSLGNRMAKLCQSKNVPFIVNDDPFIANECEADGVHLGQTDIVALPISKVRKVIGCDKLIGLSTHSLDQFIVANQEDLDYIAFGPVFPTQTKDYFIGTKDLSEVIKISRKPVIFIGGINLSNIDELLNAGVKNIALIRGILQAQDIFEQTKQFKQKLITASKEALR